MDLNLSSPYSPLKILHHPGKVQQLRLGVQPVPLQVQLIISDLCNQDCGFCAYRMSGYTSNELFKVVKPDGSVTNNPNRMIPPQKVQGILYDCSEMGVKAIQFTGGGEPTVHPNHGDFFKLTIGLGMDLALVTNGVRLKPEVLDTLGGAKWVRVSLDAATAETYATIRRVPGWHHREALKNIGELVKRRPGGDLLVGVGFVVTADNWHEVFLAAQIAKDLGVDNFRISAVFQNDGATYFAPFYERARDLCKQAAALSTPEFKVFNMFGDRVEDLEQANPDYNFCGYQHLNTYIGGDQNVYRCCNLAYNTRGLIGSLKEQRFKDLWLSQAKQQDFDEFDARNCERCMFNGKNRAIIAALQQPRHVNFI